MCPSSLSDVQPAVLSHAKMEAHALLRTLALVHPAGQGHHAPHVSWYPFSVIVQVSAVSISVSEIVSNLGNQ